jgi:O-antigen/teichoic acid export membrane protein
VWSPELWKSVLRSNLPVGVALFLAQSFMNLPALVLGYVASAADVGIFSAAMKIVFMLLLVDRIFNALFLPAVTRYAVRGPQELEPFLTLMVKIVLIIVLPLTTFVMIGSPWAIQFVFGGVYNEAVPVLRILSWYVGLTVLNSVFVASLIGSGSERSYTRLMIIGSTFTAVTVVFLARASGITGAALGVVLGELLTVVLMGHRAGKIAGLHLTRAMAWPLVGGVAMTGTAILLDPLGDAAALAGSLAVFTSTLWLSGSLRKEEIAFLREKML